MTTPNTQPKPPQPPESMRMVLVHAAEALSLERAALAVASPLRSGLQRVTRTVASLWVRLFGTLDRPASDRGIEQVTEALQAGIASVDVHVGRDLAPYVDRALHLGVRQAATEVGQLVQLQPTLSATIKQVVAGADVAVTDRLAVAANAAGSLTVDTTWSAATTVLAHAHRAVTTAEQVATWSTNAAVNDGAGQVADALGVERLWIAERNACVHCLGLSGYLSERGTFDPTATFGTRPLPVWPNGILTGPPRHPHCRCRVQPWLGSAPGYTGPDLPTALRREAQRSVLSGWHLDSESESVRVAAARHLLARGTSLPKSVQARARRAILAGTFTTTR